MLRACTRHVSIMCQFAHLRLAVAVWVKDARLLGRGRVGGKVGGGGVRPQTVTHLPHKSALLTATQENFHSLSRLQEILPFFEKNLLKKWAQFPEGSNLKLD